MSERAARGGRGTTGAARRAQRDGRAAAGVLLQYCTEKKSSRKTPKNGRAPRAKRAAHAHFWECPGFVFPTILYSHLCLLKIVLSYVVFHREARAILRFLSSPFMCPDLKIYFCSPAPLLSKSAGMYSAVGHVAPRQLGVETA